MDALTSAGSLQLNGLPLHPLLVHAVVILVPLRKMVLTSGPEQIEVPGNARFLALASIVAWSGAITAGRLLAYLVP